jgi:hypothetical protein
MPLAILEIAQPVRLSTTGNPETRRGIQKIRELLIAGNGDHVVIERTTPEGVCNRTIVKITEIQVAQRKRQTRAVGIRD